MTQLQIILLFAQAHWVTIVGILYGVSAIISTLITALTDHPMVETWLHRIQGALSWLEHANVGGWKVPFAKLTRPVVSQPVERPSVKVVLFVALFAAASAKAQVLSVGASLPMLEFQSQQTHPVQFAPGLGVEGALGLFQFAAFGKSFDALDLSAQLFGNAPGALQCALLVGTLNNLISVGAALPLYAGDGSGVFQGAFHVYPVLSLSIPLAFGPYSPPVGTAAGPDGLPRGLTLYLP